MIRLNTYSEPLVSRIGSVMDGKIDKTFETIAPIQEQVIERKNQIV